MKHNLFFLLASGSISGGFADNVTLNILIISCAVIVLLFIILWFVMKMQSLKYENVKRLEESKARAEIESIWRKSYFDLVAKKLEFEKNLVDKKLKEDTTIVEAESLAKKYRESFDQFLKDVKNKVGIPTNT